MTLENDIVRVLTQCRDEIRANMASKGINASGRTSKAFEVRRYKGGIMLVLAGSEHAPLETLEIGRPGGNVPGGFRTTKAGIKDVSNVFKYMLVQWAAEKGIPDFGWGQATMLGRRIAEKGTLRHSNPEDVYSTPVGKAEDELRGDIRASIAGQIYAVLRNFK